MSASFDSNQLISQLRDGEDVKRRQALTEAYQRYFVRLVCLLRQRLPPYLCRRVEAADLAQSAWGSFLRGLTEGRLDLAGHDSLWPLLAQIAIRKYQDQVEAFHAQKRDVTRETPLDAGTAPEPVAHAASPLEELAAAETVELLASRMADERQRQILAMHLGGYRAREIAAEVRLSERTVKRVLKRVRDLYEELFEPPSGNDAD